MAQTTQGGPSGSTSTIAYQTTLGRWAVVGLIMVGMVFSLVDRQIIALLVDPVKNDLGLSDTQFSLLIGPAFVVFYITFGFPFGLLADRIQRRHVIALGVAVWSVATVACGLAGSFFALAAARALVGAGEASLMPSSMSIMSDLFSRERLPFVTSIFSVSIHIGGALAMLIGGAILSVFDGVQTVSTPLFGDLAPWQLAFVLVGLPGLILAVVFLIIPEPQRKMSSAQSAADQIDQSELVAFIKRNRRTISAQFGVAALLTIGTYAFMSWTPAYLIRAQGLSSGEAALLIGVIMLVCGPAGTVGGGALSTWLMQKKNRVDAPWIVMMLGAAGSGVMGVLAYASPIQTLSIACLAIAILCGSLYIGVVHAALQLITPGRLRGRMAAIMLIVMTGIGATSGPVLVALITDYLFADPKMVGFSIAIIVALVGVLVCLLLGRNLASYRESYQRIDQSGDAAAL